MFLHTPSQGVSSSCISLEIRKILLHRRRSQQTTKCPLFLCKASGHYVWGTVLDREAERPSKPGNLSHEHDELLQLAAQLSGRQESQAGTGTSYGSIPKTSQHTAPLQGRRVSGVSSTDSKSGQTPSLTGPPRLVRPSLPRRTSTETSAEHSSSASLVAAGIDSSHGMPIVDRSPAAERVYWRGSVMSREAVLGRMLVRLPAGHSVGDVLYGEMLSSKQITRCLAAPQTTWTPPASHQVNSADHMFASRASIIHLSASFYVMFSWCEHLLGKTQL